ncbi:ribosomal protein S4 [Hamiltosporidium magnivora]|uniref:Ribosomal protein S4 n=1 Tax=Hamiltosporidium magnivora TaxID=148818 RepID=A0A4Q9LIK9_9MICR|nr:ribosomal protein S4 [Hamiltosporidium magnivora]
MARPRSHKRSKNPKRPYDRDRLLEEMKLVGMFGLKNKRELWTIQKICDDIKRRARDLLISNDEKQQIVDGRCLLNKIVKIGIFEDVDFRDRSDIVKNLEKVLNLTPVNFLERRLQHRVFEAGLSKSVHQARVMINQRHISIKGRITDKPGYIVSAENEGFIEIAPFSSLGGNKLSKRKKKNRGHAGHQEELTAFD